MGRTVGRTGHLIQRSSEGGGGNTAYLSECVQKIFSVCDALPVQNIFGLNGVCRSALSRKYDGAGSENIIHLQGNMFEVDCCSTVGMCLVTALKDDVFRRCA